MGTVTFQKVDVDGIGVDRGYVKVNETTDDRLAHSLDPARDEDALSGKFGFTHLAIPFALRRNASFFMPQPRSAGFGDTNSISG